MADAPLPAGKRKMVTLVISLIFFAAVAVYISRSLVAGIRQVRWDEVELHWPLLAASLLSAILTNLLAAESNYNLISTIAPHLPRRRIYTAILISRLGRYIPGKVATVAGAGLMLREEGVSALAASSLVAFNTLLTCAVGLLVGLPLLLGPIFRQHASSANLAIGAAALLVGMSMLHPRIGLPIFAAIIKRVTGRKLDVNLPTRALVRSILCITLNWISNGASLWLVMRAVGFEASAALLLSCISASAVAITIGFLALFAPGGLGVREWVFLAFLTPIAGAGPAAIMTICMRVVHLLADVVSALTGNLLIRCFGALGKEPRG